LLLVTTFALAYNLASFYESCFLFPLFRISEEILQREVQKICADLEEAFHINAKRKYSCNDPVERNWTNFQNIKEA